MKKHRHYCLVFFSYTTNYMVFALSNKLKISKNVTARQSASRKQLVKNIQNLMQQTQTDKVAIGYRLQAWQVNLPANLSCGQLWYCNQKNPHWFRNRDRHYKREDRETIDKTQSTKKVFRLLFFFKPLHFNIVCTIAYKS